LITANELLRKVEELDWSCIDADTRYATHTIHRYSGKFIPQIAGQAVELLSNKGDCVLDPYCGSGTTLLECALAGRRSIGIDLNPMAALISKVKTTPVNKQDAEAFVARMLERLEVVDGIAYAPNVFSSQAMFDLETDIKADYRWYDPWYTKWFNDKIRFELIALYKEIEQQPEVNLRNLAWVAFSDILRRASNASSSYPNIMFDKNKKNNARAISLFLARFKEIAKSAAGLNGAFTEDLRPQVIEADARSLPLEDGVIDAIVTHPPYIGSIPYAEYGELSLVWLGHSPKELDNNLTGGRRQLSDIIERFGSGFQQMIHESHRVLKDGGYMFMLVGHPTVRGKKVDLSKMAKGCALESGFLLLVDHQRKGINRRANLMGHENLLFFRKPPQRIQSSDAAMNPS
jgi:site-specific DNA-methyltransferase (cytosine-N4-specific)